MSKIIIIAALVISLGVYEAWNWWFISFKTYRNSTSTCDQVYSSLRDSISKNNLKKLEYEKEKLLLTVSMELHNSNSKFKDSYIKDDATTSIFNLGLKTKCEQEPKKRFSTAVKEFIAEIN